MYLGVCNYKNEWEPFFSLFFETGYSQAKNEKSFSRNLFCCMICLHSYRELTIFAKAYLANLKLTEMGEIQKFLPKNREKHL